MTDTRPVADQVQAGLDHADPHLVSLVRALERIAAARTVIVATNRSFPNWTIERWITVLTFVGMIVGFIWFAGVAWADMRKDVQAVKTSIDGLSKRVDDNRMENERRYDQIRQRLDLQRKR